MTSTGGQTICVSCHTSSPDGNLVIYTRDSDSSVRAIDVRTIQGMTPAANVVSPSALAGASDPGTPEFYPIYSPDDVLLAFNRAGTDNSYNEPTAEVFVVPGDGGTATRLSANDPPMCTGLTSPGLTNSWSRWAPSSTTVGDKKYYWLVFSSKRHAPSNDGMGHLLPQLYVASIVTQVKDGNETLAENHPALYVASQNPTQNNHTPAWDVFKVKQVPPR
jgi:hypothetical protein